LSIKKHLYTVVCLIVVQAGVIHLYIILLYRFWITGCSMKTGNVCNTKYCVSVWYKTGHILFRVIIYLLCREYVSRHVLLFDPVILTKLNTFNWQGLIYWSRWRLLCNWFEVVGFNYSEWHNCLYIVNLNLFHLRLWVPSACNYTVTVLYG